MFRAAFTVSMITVWCCMATVQGAPKPAPVPEPAPEPVPEPVPEPAPEPVRKDLSYLEIDEEEGMPIIDDYATKQFGELRTVLSTIKAQFREIIEDIMAQVLNYCLEIFKQIKVKLLKKLARYNVSDVLRVVFDGFTDFLVEPEPEYYEPIREPSTSSSYGYRPFSLASFLGVKK